LGDLGGDAKVVFSRSTGTLGIPQISIKDNGCESCLKTNRVMTNDDKDANHVHFSLDLAREIEFYADRAFAMSSCHRKTAEVYGNCHMLLGLPAAILASIAGVSAFANYSNLAGVTAFVVSGLTGTMSFLNPAEKQKLHFEAANALETWSTKTYLLVKRSRASIIEVTELIHSWDQLMKERDQISKQSPLVPSWAKSKPMKKLMEPFYQQ
jgi:hypothetical protein